MTRPRFSPKAPHRPAGSTGARVPPPDQPPAAAATRSPLRERTLPAVGLPVPMAQSGRRQWPTGPVAVALLLVGIFVTAAGIGHATGAWPALSRAANRPPPRAFPVLDPSWPTRIEIPAIGVRAPVRGVGLADDGSVAVPPLARHWETGWFERGPTPGQFGPALIVGHADTRSGPSVFYAVPTLRPGARIEVVRRDRQVAVFKVNSVEHFDKGRLPLDRVYGDYRRPSLRLITCGGRWLGEGIGYADNIVVFASLVATRRA
jgi:Sortase domain